MNVLSAMETRVPTAIRFFDVALAGDMGPIDCGAWEIATGEAWFVAGGARAGKTTLLRVMAALERPAVGRITRFGADWSEGTEEQMLAGRRRIGVMLSHDAGLFHRASVAENIRLPLHYHGGGEAAEVNERTERLLAALDLERHARRSSARVGISVARRTLLARALAVGPEVLLLDDPCAGLEDRERRWLIQFILRLNRGHELNDNRPMTVVVTGRSPTEWRHAAGFRWALLRDGRLGIAQTWEQLVASAPELINDGGPEAAPD